MNDKDLTYLGSRRNPPAIHHTTTEQLNIIEEVGNILGVFDYGLANTNSPRTLYTQDNDLNPAELVGGEAIHTTPPLDNGDMLPLLTQPPSQSPPLADVQESPLTGSCEDTSKSTHLASEKNIPGDFLTDADDMLFGVYQDRVHQNPGAHLDDCIEEDGKWQNRRENYSPPHPTIWCTVWKYWEAVCWDSCSGDQRNLELALERGEGDRISNSYFAARPPGVYCNKHTQPDSLTY